MNSFAYKDSVNLISQLQLSKLNHLTSFQEAAKLSVREFSI